MTRPIKIYNDQLVIYAAKRRLDDLFWFARKDGFDSWDEMLDFFKKLYGLPFEGVLITW